MAAKKDLTMISGYSRRKSSPRENFNLSIDQQKTEIALNIVGSVVIFQLTSIKL